MAEVLRRAVRFTAREDGTVEFAGVVDECGVTCDEKGLQLEVSGRGMAALLLDNEAESVSYQWATMEENPQKPVTPYGIECTGHDAVTAAARYRVANGSEPVEGAEQFCGAARRDRTVFRQDGRAGGEEKPQGRAREHRRQNAGDGARLLRQALRRDRRGTGGGQQGGREAEREKRGVLCSRRHEQARILRAGAQRHAGNALHGGVSDRKVEGGRGDAARDDRGGGFTAAPGDIAAVSGTKIGIVGNFRVIECVRRFGESGEAMRSD